MTLEQLFGFANPEAIPPLPAGYGVPSIERMLT